MTSPRLVHVLNLGAGVQSTTLYLMAMAGELPRLDSAIFADTQEEPEAVYHHLNWLQSLNGPPILIRSAGKLGDHIKYGRNSTGGRFAAIPCFTNDENGNLGRGKRQCSSEYKIEVIEKTIRRDVLNLNPRQRVPKEIKVLQYFGISWDERSRASRIWERYHIPRTTWAEPIFPLVERQWTRANCIEYLENKVPHQTPRSACVFCPFHSDAEWQQIKDANGPDWVRAIEIDAALRIPGNISDRGLNGTRYLHPSRRPLTQIDFRPHVNPKELQLGFGVECDGVCGV